MKYDQPVASSLMLGGRQAWPLHVLLALTVLALPMASALPWLQPRGDAAATGALDEAGPAWPDVAWRVQLPEGLNPTDAPPLILDDRILLSAAPYEYPEDAAYQRVGPWHIVSVDIDTGEITQVEEIMHDAIPESSTLAEGEGRIATDGQTVFLAGDRSVHARPIAPGGTSWDWSFEPRTQEGAVAQCIRLRLEQEHLTVMCEEAWYGGDTAGATPLIASQAVTLTARLDAATGEEQWLWEDPPQRSADEPALPTSEHDPSSRGTVPIGLAITGSRVLIHVVEMTGQEPGQVTPVGDPGGGEDSVEYQHAVWALDLETGDAVWKNPSELDNVWAPDPEDEVSLLPPRPLSGNPAAADDAVYVKAGSVFKLALSNGARVWEKPIGAEDFGPSSSVSPALALAEGQLFTASAQTVYRLDTGEQTSGWSSTIDLSDLKALDEDPIVTPDAIYTAAVPTSGSGGSGDETGAVYAFDTEDGSVLWQTPTGNVQGLSVGHGLVAFTDLRLTDDGTRSSTLTALGRTPASPTTAVDVSSLYPAPGESVHADLSGSEPGLHGPATRYKAIWGDGSESPWQEDPVLDHTYGEAGNVTARFLVGNEAGQSASAVRTFHVGGSPPSQPTLLQRAFAPENQLITLSGIGLGVLLLGAVAMVVVSRRRRADEADRLAAYERVVQVELAEGREGHDLRRRTAPMRSALRVSDKEHARIVHRLVAGPTGAALPVPGETFLDRYEVRRRLGAGGGGATYLCHDERIGRDVVVKALHTPPGDVQETIREARAFGAIHDANVVSLYDVEQVGDRVFLVLEHVGGGSLDQLQDPPPPARLAQDLLSGLGAVHRAGVVHRDVKPSNLLVTEQGRFKLGDFGIARTPGLETSIGGLGGGAAGTVRYMSPEQARGQDIDGRSDLYSAAVVLWEMLADAPYMEARPGETATGLQMRIAQADGLPRELPNADEETRAWLQKALDPVPGRRFASAKQMLKALPTGLASSD